MEQTEEAFQEACAQFRTAPDLFRDEDILIAQRLSAAGVPVEFHLWTGAYHASELFAPQATLSQRIWATRYAAIRRFAGI